MYKILIVDDEENIREVLKEYAEFEGHEVDEAGDGMKAIEMARAKEYDIIIMMLCSRDWTDILPAKKFASSSRRRCLCFPHAARNMTSFTALMWE